MASLGLRLGHLARIVRGTLLGHEDIAIDTVTTDSREKTAAGLFVALRGDRFDGHDFATQAVANGAIAVLVDKQIDGLMAPHILVRDTLAALHSLAGWRRAAFMGSVAAITGSTGKTTTRRMLHAILQARGPTHQPIRNFNNHIGVPLSLLGLDEAHHAAVFELGCSDFGEIGPLTAMVNPDVGLITNVGPAHLEKLGSLDGVARAKGELFDAMRESSIAVINGDDPRIAAMVTSPSRRMVFGSTEAADIRFVERRAAGTTGQTITLIVAGNHLDATTRFIGAHNASNATAAIAAAAAMGATPEEMIRGLREALPQPGRLVLVPGRNGTRVVDDTYNANPASMRAALRALKETAGASRTIAILADMLELGATADEAHLEIGHFVASLGIDVLITLGDRAELIREGAEKAGLMDVVPAKDHQHAADLALARSRPEDMVLVKGSRGMAMEKVVDRIREERG